jgi:hypothetical protein
MDNGLIFPYRCECVPAEPSDANHPPGGVLPSGGLRRVRVGPGLVVGKRWGDAGR